MFSITILHEIFVIIITIQYSWLQFNYTFFSQIVFKVNITKLILLILLILITFRLITKFKSNGELNIKTLCNITKYLIYKDLIKILKR